MHGEDEQRKVGLSGNLVADKDFRGVEQIYNLRDKVRQVALLTDEAKAWKSVRSRISKKYLVNWGAFVRYAAVVFVAIVGTWLLKDYIQSGTTSPVVLDSGDNIVTVSYGSKSTVHLPDGSVVKLNSGSTLIYPSKFDNNKRTVRLEGEGYFEVEKDKNRPFFVNTSAISIKVLGTVFNVKSYPEENTIEATLVSGAIEIYDNNGKENLSGKEKPLTALVPNQKASFIKAKLNETAAPTVNSELQLKAVENITENLFVEKKVDPEVYTAWKDGVLRFDNERFADIVVKMERWYDVHIDLQNPELRDERFSGKFTSETIEQALKALTLTEPFAYSIEKNRITISKR